MGRRVYVDANFIIYLVQGFAQYRQQLDEFRDALREKQFRPVTSEFTLCEVLVRPLQLDHASEVERYVSLLRESGAFELATASASTFISAAKLRATLGLKAPDAIHVATAVEARCTAFLSNDLRLKVPPELVQIRFD